MSATQEWIKQKYAEESPRIITEYSVQKELDEVKQDIKKLQEDVAWMIKKYS